MTIPVILFQFIAPAFLPALEVFDQEVIRFEPLRSGVISPAFLKEIEKESEQTFADEKSVALLDFSCHFDNLNSRCKQLAHWHDQVHGDHAVSYFMLYRTFRM